MATWCVAHVIHVTTPFEYRPRLVIKDVPNDVEITWEDIELAGYYYGEFGVPRGNHWLTRITRKSPWGLRRAVRRAHDVTITYDDLLRRIEDGKGAFGDYPV
jgi:hypothetical protein